MAFENYKIAVLSLAAAQERLAKEEEAKGDDKKRALHKQWLKNGAANHGHRWQFLAPSRVVGYVNMAKKYTATELLENHTSESTAASIGHIAHSTKDLAKVTHVHGCKYLHIHNQHNSLAEDIEHYKKVSLRSGLVEVCIYVA